MCLLPVSLALFQGRRKTGSCGCQPAGTIATNICGIQVERGTARLLEKQKDLHTIFKGLTIIITAHNNKNKDLILTFLSDVLITSKTRGIAIQS